MKRMIGVLSSVLLAASVARAGVDIKIGASGGAIYGGDPEKRKPVYGAQAVARFTDAISAELAVQRLSDWDTEERLGFTATGTAHFTPVTLSGRYSLPLGSKGVRVYGLVGVGCYFYDTIDLSVDTAGPGPFPVAVDGDPRMRMDPALGDHFGLGFEWAICRHLEAFAEYRYAYIWNRGSLSGFKATGPQGDYVIDKIKEDWIDNHELGIWRLGLNYLF